MALKGVGIVCKARLFIWVLFDSTPRTLLRKLSFLRNNIEYIKDKLVKYIITNFSGSKLACIDSESIWIVLSPDSENWIWSYLRLGKGDVFVDVGAHVGKYTVSIAKVVGEKGLVIAIEPHPENYKILMENVRLNGLKNVIGLNIAAWSEECKLKLFIAGMHGRHSIKKDFGLGSLSVKARPLDDVFDELVLKRCNYIKIDVEGSELEVLKGLVKTLKKYSPTVIVEILKDPTEVRKFINKVGYDMRQIAPCYYILRPSHVQHIKKIREAKKV
jgi:FkbM family methyltransferase